MEDVELFAHELDRLRNEFVRLIVGVDPKEARHDEEVAVRRKDVLELRRRVDHGRHAVSENARVFGVQGQRAVDHVNEELNVRGVGEVASHRLEHPRDQTNPIEFVQNVEAVHFLQRKKQVRKFSLFAAF